MSVLSWNCRGLGNPWVFRFLKDLIIQKRPNFVFLCETKSRREKVERLRRSVGFDGSFVVEARGQSGGLAMLWKERDDAELLSYSSNHVDMVACQEGLLTFRLTGFYGEPDKNRHSESWSLLKRLAMEFSLPWCVIGDLNNTLSHRDMRGGNPYPANLITGFQDTCDACELIDMELVGYPFTWERGRGSRRWMEVRLDRALVSQSFYSLFPMARLENLEVTVSDHCPIFLTCLAARVRRQERKFRFENSWLREQICQQIVKDKWGHQNGEEVDNKLGNCKIALVEWGKTVTGDLGSQIAECNRVLRKLRSKHDVTSVSVYKKTRDKLMELLVKKEVFWRQRAKQLWL